ncbi:MAG: hypothetical protein V4594_21685 [Bacteroidota bacterium]
MDTQTTNLYLSPLDALGLRLYLRKGDDEISAFNQACEFCRKHGYSNWRLDTHGIYLLRYPEATNETGKLIFGILETPSLPEALHQVIDLLRFYNRYGLEVYPNAKKRGETYQEYVLRKLARDCQEIVGSSAEFSTGYGQSHVWVANRLTSRRILLMHF